MITGLKTGVNESEDSVKLIRQSHLDAAACVRNYLENGYARIFGELPLQFSNDAPALI